MTFLIISWSLVALCIIVVLCCLHWFENIYGLLFAAPVYTVLALLWPVLLVVCIALLVFFGVCMAFYMVLIEYNNMRRI